MLSSATRRAIERQYDQPAEWYCDFRYHDIAGLEYAEGIHRRDPSSVIEHDDRFYVWYTRSEGRHTGFGGSPADKVFPWDQADVWWASSDDGVVWKEEGPAVTRGAAGSYDDRSVFTPNVLHDESGFHLVYQVLASPYRMRSPESIAIASSPTPEGPWEKSPQPILDPTTETGEWYGTDDNRLAVITAGDFDSLKVHDPCLLAFQGQYWLYYKGEPMGEQWTMGGRPTKCGVAVADHPHGPYRRSPLNPVTNSGHETCLWLHRDGIAALVTTDGPERNTIQFSPDGLNFEIKSYLKSAPEAAGPFTAVSTHRPLDGLRWGMCHDLSQPWASLRMFRADETAKGHYRSAVSPESFSFDSARPVSGE